MKTAEFCEKSRALGGEKLAPKSNLEVAAAFIADGSAVRGIEQNGIEEEEGEEIW